MNTNYSSIEVLQPERYEPISEKYNPPGCPADYQRRCRIITENDARTPAPFVGEDGRIYYHIDILEEKSSELLDASWKNCLGWVWLDTVQTIQGLTLHRNLAKMLNQDTAGFRVIVHNINIAHIPVNKTLFINPLLYMTCVHGIHLQIYNPEENRWVNQPSLYEKGQETEHAYRPRPTPPLHSFIRIENAPKPKKDLCSIQ